MGHPQFLLPQPHGRVEVPDSPEEREQQRQAFRLQDLSQFQRAANAARFVYSRETKRFVTNATSRAGSEATEAVLDRQVISALDEALESAKSDVRALTQKLVDGEISLQRWQRSMTEAVKNAHLNAGALTKGGFDNLDQRDYGQIGGRIADELEYLRGFAEDIANGDQRLDGTALRRSEMYVDKARKTHHKLHRREMQKIGYNQERNVLGVAEHCEECVELTNRGDNGWVPNGTLTPIGDRICLSNCKCRIEYRNTETTDPSKFPSVRK